MNSIIATLQVTFKESIRNKILYNIFIFAITLFMIGIIVGNWSLGEKERVILDFGLTGLHLISLLIAIFVGIHLIAREINSRTIYNTLAKPIKRYQFLLGKFLGLSLTLLVNMLLLALILCFLMKLFTGSFRWDLFLPALFIYFEMLIIVAVSLLFSILTNTTLASILTIFIYITGHLLQPVMEYLHKIKNIEETVLALPYYILKITSFFIPNLNLFNIINEFVHDTPINLAYIFYSASYFMIFLASLLTVSIFVFQRKDLT